nr:hypothetical protein [Tanacetum cinerariifolium]
MIDLHANVELKDTLVVALPKMKDQCPKKTVTDMNVKTQRQVVRDLLVSPKPHVVYKHVQATTAKKTNNRQAKEKDTNSNKVSSNNNSGLNFMVDVASLSGTKIVTSNPFDVLNMV